MQTLLRVMRGVEVVLCKLHMLRMLTQVLVMHSIMCLLPLRLLLPCTMRHVRHVDSSQYASIMPALGDDRSLTALCN